MDFPFYKEIFIHIIDSTKYVQKLDGSKHTQENSYEVENIYSNVISQFSDENMILFI